MNYLDHHALGCNTLNILASLHQVSVVLLSKIFGILNKPFIQSTGADCFHFTFYACETFHIS